MKKRNAFTMLELIFVIVVMGILAKYGVEFLAQSYKNFIFSQINNKLQNQSEQAVEFIANRLQYRIKDSTIARQTSTSSPVAISNATGDSYNILEWIGYDVDGYRGIDKPYWSGVLDLDDGNATTLVSPETNTTALDNHIRALSDNNTTVDDIAIYFVGANSDATSDYGWDGNITKIQAQKGAIHPVKATSNINEFTSSTSSNFSGIDVYEYYKLAWSAYAIVMEDYNTTTHTGNLYMYYDYQPWRGEKFSDTGKGIKKALIMQNVSSFRFYSVDDVLKIQVCVKTNLVEEYSLCKEKTVF